MVAESREGAMAELTAVLNSHQKLRKDSWILRMARACDEAMPMEEVGKSLIEIFRDTDSNSIKLRVLKELKSLAQLRDDKEEKHQWGEMEPEDLYAVLRGAALEMLRKDEGFSASVIAELVEEKPGLLDQIRPQKAIEVMVSDAQ